MVVLRNVHKLERMLVFIVTRYIIFCSLCLLSPSLSPRRTLRESRSYNALYFYRFVSFCVLFPTCPVAIFQYTGCVLSKHHSLSQYRLSILRSFILTEESLVCRWLWIYFHSLFSWRGPHTHPHIHTRSRTHTHKVSLFVFVRYKFRINGRLIELLSLMMNL